MVLRFIRAPALHPCSLLLRMDIARMAGPEHGCKTGTKHFPGMATGVCQRLDLVAVLWHSSRFDDRRNEEALAVGARSVAQSRRAGERFENGVGSQDVR